MHRLALQWHLQSSALQEAFASVLGLLLGHWNKRVLAPLTGPPGAQNPTGAATHLLEPADSTP